MGKGDKRTKKGKRILSTWGVHRPRTDKNSVAPVATKKKAKKTKAAPKKAAAKKEVVEEVVAAVEAPKKEAAPKKEKAAPKKATKKAAAKGDDLTKVEGIGPKVMEVLNGAGIVSFADLAGQKAEKVAEILIEANSRYKMFDPTSWPLQAGMAAVDKWDELKKWQDEHDGGKM